MVNYAINKCVSIVVPIVFIAVISLTMAPPVSWSMMLVGISLLGYTHYLLGAYYQHKAWRNRPSYVRYMFWFMLITIISGILVVGARAYEAIWLVALLTIPYFVWHGYENEHTLFTRSTGQKMNPGLLVGISLVVVGLTIDAFRHSSALFATSLIYSSALLPSTQQLFTVLSPALFLVGLSCVIAGIIFLLLSIKNERSPIRLGWLIVILGTCGWFWYANPLPYVWLFVLLLGYHFLTWGIHYGVIFWPKQKAFFTYLAAHVLVVVGVVLASAVVSAFVVQLPLGLLNTEFFLFMTLSHIGTSFLNEPWLKQYLSL
jgi:hypothetical protein